MKSQFEEVVVEEAVVEETAPSNAEQFVSLLVNMGLSAEQAEAVHQMAMDLIEAGGEAETEEVETVAVAASKQSLMEKKKFTAEQKLEMLERRVRRMSRQLRDRDNGRPAERKFNTSPEGRKEQRHEIPRAKATGTQGRAFEIMEQILNQ